MVTDSFRDTEVLGSLPGFCALVVSITDWRAGTFTEASYTGYDAGARPAITYDAAENMTPNVGRQRKNTSQINFPQNTGSTQDIIGWAGMSATTGGVAKGFGLLDADLPIIGTVSLASPGVVTAYAHGLSTNQRVFVFPQPGCVIPTGFAMNTAYFVANVTTDTFTLSTTTANGNPVNTSAAGEAMFVPYTAVTVAASASPQVAAGAIKFQI